MIEDSPSLFDIEYEHRTDPQQPVRMKAVARHTDPITSHQAAASVRDISKTHERVLEVLDRYGPATDEEIERYYYNLAELFEWPKASASGLRSRRAELVAIGKVYDTGQRGQTASGRPTTIWELKEHQ
jgi:hypothetical protein